MGIVDWRYLAAAMEDDGDPDEATEIGSMPQTQVPTAMRVGTAEAGGDELVYLGETELWVTPTWKIEQLNTGKTHQWWRLEAKVPGKNSPITKTYDLVVAEAPYHNGWVHHAPFKPGSKKSDAERPRPQDQPDIHSGDDLLKWLEQDLRYDYWEKGNYLTAGISAPQPAFAETGDRRQIKTGGLYVFGACENYNEAEAKLFQSEAVQTLLRRTEANTIQFAPKGVGAGNIRLYPEVIDDAISLLYLSIRQALAGPDDDGEDWLDRPVTDRIDQLYRNHLNNRNRVVAERRKKEVEVDGDDSRQEPGEAQADDQGRGGLTRVEMEVEKEKYQAGERQGRNG